MGRILWTERVTQRGRLKGNGGKKHTLIQEKKLKFLRQRMRKAGLRQLTDNYKGRQDGWVFEGN